MQIVLALVLCDTEVLVFSNLLINFPILAYIHLFLGYALLNAARRSQYTITRWFYPIASHIVTISTRTQLAFQVAVNNGLSKVCYAIVSIITYQPMISISSSPTASL